MFAKLRNIGHVYLTFALKWTEAKYRGDRRGDRAYSEIFNRYQSLGGFLIEHETSCSVEISVSGDPFVSSSWSRLESNFSCILIRMCMFLGAWKRARRLYFTQDCSGLRKLSRPCERVEEGHAEPTDSVVTLLHPWWYVKSFFHFLNCRLGGGGGTQTCCVNDPVTEREVAGGGIESRVPFETRRRVLPYRRLATLGRAILLGAIAITSAPQTKLFAAGVSFDDFLPLRGLLHQKITKERYQRGFSLFHSFSKNQGLPLSTKEEVDDCLELYIDGLYIAHEGRGRQRAVEAFASVLWKKPRLKGCLMASACALKAWSRVAPGRSYLPISWEVCLCLCFLLGPPSSHTLVCFV